MNNRAIHHLIVVTVFFISLTGCASIDKNLGVAQFKPTRYVENNLFSSSFPELKLQISPDLKYLGSVRLFQNTETRMSSNTNPAENVEADSYLFGQIDRNNRITKGVLIRTLVMQGDPSLPTPQIFAKTSRNVLQSGEMKILEETYQYDLYAEPELFVPKETTLLGSSRAPSCFLVKQLSNKTGFGNKSRLQMLYFEDASTACANRSCGTCFDPQNRTAEQKQFIQAFTDRSYSSTRFMKTKTIEDTTSRYVDAEPKMQPAPVAPAPAEQIRPQPAPVEKAQPAPAERVQPPPVETVRPAPAAVVPAAPAEKAQPAPAVAEPGKIDALEKRLEALKRIYEKNLISKEDYEKKKAELLKEL
jgi:hypothetical protein